MYKKTLLSQPWLPYDCPCVTTLVIPKASHILCDERVKNDAFNPTKERPRKCRAEQAKVVSHECKAYCLSRWYRYIAAPRTTHSMYDPKFQYRVGETVRPTKPYDESDEECSHGIHFCPTKEEAENYAS